MNEVQLYTIVHFGRDIVRPKIESIVSYVGGSTKLTSLREHSSYEDFVTLLEETSEIRLEDCKLGLDPRRFGHFVDDDVVPQSNDSFETIRTDVPPSNEPSISQSNHLSNEPLLTNVPQSNEPFQTIPTNVPFSNEPSIPQSSIHLSNEHMLTNLPPSNKPMLTNVPLSIEPEPIIGQTETSDLVGLQYILGIPKETWSNLYIPMTRYGVTYINNVESWNNVILKITSYGRTDSVNIEDGICSCCWWQTMGIPCKHGVRALGLADIDPTIRVSEYFTNNTYKAVYEPIWIPIRGIEQWEILKTDTRVRAPIPTVRAGRPLT
ncbi:hypothetical protein GIB67_033983 [Kingdonia uniflora]|uniref:SWIM-type domain-containing protein n=1 Tax=Kingdonia uniflora TaxID=39325 RepID=A0A7J7M683_9MAGN|nr:hypothetical protein GIB67_033983 [Kingdonia uniflora]